MALFPLHHRTAILPTCEPESTVRIQWACITIDDAFVRTVLRSDDYGLTTEVDITVAVACVGTIGNQYRVTVNRRIDTLLNRRLISRDVNRVCLEHRDAHYKKNNRK
jgi:hypothetical protein